MDELRLIEVLQHHKCLYDAKNQHYNDMKMRGQKFLLLYCGSNVFQGYEETCLFTKHESLQGDSPRVHPNILKCSFHSLVTKGIRLVGFATRAMVCESPTHYLILNSLAFARGCVILRSHFLILLLLIILISHHIHS